VEVFIKYILCRTTWDKGHDIYYARASERQFSAWQNDLYGVGKYIRVISAGGGWVSRIQAVAEAEPLWVKDHRSKASNTITGARHF
jgi:hypothetical protein